MKCLVAIILVLAASFPVFAADNPCYSKAVPFKSVPHDKRSTITLEARRVKATSGDSMTYDLGREIITIKADSFQSQRFLMDVKGGRCSARETVTLEPMRKSPFNTVFKAQNPHH